MTDIVLHYHDVVIREADLETLNEGRWLNDTMLEFHMEFIERTFVPKDAHYLFLRPGITHLIKFASENVTDLIPALPPNIDKKQVIFIPINDGNATEAYSGTHWSLMVYVRAVNAFYYYDSLKFNNKKQAEYTSKRIRPLLGVKVKPQFIPATTPQQQNGSDCGVYVISIIDYLLSQLLNIQVNKAVSYDKVMHLKEKYMTSPEQVRYNMFEMITRLQVKSYSK